MSKSEFPSIARCPADALRPDLRIPLPAGAGDGLAFLAVLTRLGEPRFADAYRGLWRRLALVAALVAGQFLVVAWFRPWIVAVAAVLALDLVVRAIALKLLERRQRAFERQWLDVQSGVLRTSAFEVVRLGVEPPYGRTGGWDRRGYDLTRREEVRKLLERQGSERASGRSSQLKVEFCYSLGPPPRTAVETVHLDLADAAIVASDGTRRVRVRFPEARYYAQPSMDRLGWRHPGRTTFWVLGPAILSAASPDTPAPRPFDGSAVSTAGA